MLGLLLGVLEGSDLPPDAAQMAKIEAAMAAADKAWKEYIAGRDGLTGMEHFLIGSVAEKTVSHASCPVLIVKPRGMFESDTEADVGAEHAI